MPRFRRVTRSRFPPALVLVLRIYQPRAPNPSFRRHGDAARNSYLFTAIRLWAFEGRVVVEVCRRTYTYSRRTHGDDASIRWEQEAAAMMGERERKNVFLIYMCVFHKSHYRGLDRSRRGRVQRASFLGRRCARGCAKASRINCARNVQKSFSCRSATLRYLCGGEYFSGKHVDAFIMEIATRYLYTKVD